MVDNALEETPMFPEKKRIPFPPLVRIPKTPGRGREKLLSDCKRPDSGERPPVHEHHALHRHLSPWV